MLVLIIDVTPPLGPAYHVAGLHHCHHRRAWLDAGRAARRRTDRVTEALGRPVFTPSAKSMFAFAILVLVLLFRPQGISASERHERSA